MSGSTNDKMDLLEAAMVSGYEAVECPLTHRFSPGLYTREIFMPAGSLITSMIHRTKHQFMVLKGAVSVFSDNDGEQLIQAPFVGYTQPGTRRMLYIHQDTVWVTVHATDIEPENESIEAIEAAVSKITEQIIEPHINKVLNCRVKNNVLVDAENNIIQKINELK